MMDDTFDVQDDIGMFSSAIDTAFVRINCGLQFLIVVNGTRIHCGGSGSGIQCVGLLYGKTLHPASAQTTFQNPQTVLPP